MYILFFVKPDIMTHKYVEDIDTANMANSFFYSEVLIQFVKFSFIIFLVFLVLFIVEFLLIKFKFISFKLRNKNTFGGYVFVMGLILQIYPTLFFIYPIVIKIFNLG